MADELATIWPREDPLPVHLVVFPHAIVNAAVYPLVETFAGDLVVVALAVEAGAVRPLE